jgi:hypothetical protein
MLVGGVSLLTSAKKLNKLWALIFSDEGWKEQRHNLLDLILRVAEIKDFTK